jgi:hypothetical protein
MRAVRRRSRMLILALVAGAVLGALVVPSFASAKGPADGGKTPTPFENW